MHNAVQLTVTLSSRSLNFFSNEKPIIQTKTSIKSSNRALSWMISTTNERCANQSAGKMN